MNETSWYVQPGPLTNTPEAHRDRIWRDLMVAQDGECLICRSKARIRLHAIDHDHVTGLVRGLLCGPCNSALGLFQDNPELCLRAYKYLRDQPTKKMSPVESALCTPPLSSPALRALRSA